MILVSFRFCNFPHYFTFISNYFCSSCILIQTPLDHLLIISPILPILVFFFSSFILIYGWVRGSHHFSSLPGGGQVMITPRQGMVRRQAQFLVNHTTVESYFEARLFPFPHSFALCSYTLLASSFVFLGAACSQNLFILALLSAHHECISNK